MKGKGMLKITGILMVIFCGIGIISSMVSLVGMSAVSSLLPKSMSIGGLTVSTFLSMLVAGAGLFVGIMGIINCERPDKAKTCMMLGLGYAALDIINYIISIIISLSYLNNTALIRAGINVGGTALLTTIIGLVISLVLPALYVIGAYQNIYGSNMNNFVGNVMNTVSASIPKQPSYNQPQQPQQPPYNQPQQPQQPPYNQPQQPQQPPYNQPQQPQQPPYNQPQDNNYPNQQ